MHLITWFKNIKKSYLSRLSQKVLINIILNSIMSSLQKKKNLCRNKFYNGQVNNNSRYNNYQERGIYSFVKLYQGREQIKLMEF